MSDAVLRPATRADLAPVRALLADDPFSRNREGGADAAVEAAFDEIAADPKTTIWLYDLDGRTIGCAQLTIIPGLARNGLKRGLIEAVRIASDLRGRGHGKRFVRALVERAREAGCGVVQLTSDKRRGDAHRFYRDLGFAQSHEGFKLTLE